MHIFAKLDRGLCRDNCKFSREKPESIMLCPCQSPWSGKMLVSVRKVTQGLGDTLDEVLSEVISKLLNSLQSPWFIPLPLSKPAAGGGSQIGFNPTFARNQAPNHTVLLCHQRYAEWCVLLWVNGTDLRKEWKLQLITWGAVSLLRALWRRLAVKTMPRMAEEGFYFKVTLCNVTQ